MIFFSEKETRPRVIASEETGLLTSEVESTHTETPFLSTIMEWNCIPTYFPLHFGGSY